MANGVVKVPKFFQKRNISHNAFKIPRNSKFQLGQGRIRGKRVKRTENRAFKDVCNRIQKMDEQNGFQKLAMEKFSDCEEGKKNF